MDRNTYNITRVVDGNNFQYSFEPRAFKGTTDIILNFNFTPTTFELVKLKIAVEGQEPKWYESNIPASHVCHIEPFVDEYVYRRWIMVTAVYNNFNAAEFFIPVYVAQPSYYTDLDGLKISQAQFVDAVDNGDMFVVMQNNRNTAYNMLLRANQYIPPAATAGDVDVLAAVSAVDVPNIVNPVATDIDDNLLVIHPNQVSTPTLPDR